MTRWFVLLRFGSCKPTPRWGGHKDRVSFNPFPLSNGHLDRVSFSPQSIGSLRLRKDHHTIGVSCLDYKCLENKNGEEEKRSKRQELKWTQISLSHKPLSLWNEIGTWRGFDLLFCVLEWSIELLYWMQRLKTWMPWSVVVGGIYSPTHQNGRWGGCLSMGAPDTVRCASHVTQPLGFDHWSSNKLGHRTVTVHYLVRLLKLLWLCARCPRIVHVHCSLLQTTVGVVAVAPHGTPDSPVLHRTVWWIIAEWLSKNPKLSSSELISLVHRTLSDGAPYTVRWHTGQSGAPDQGSLRLVFAPFFWTLSWTFYWFVLNLLHLYNL
jgi:hypothetical protein